MRLGSLIGVMLLAAAAGGCALPVALGAGAIAEVAGGHVSKAFEEGCAAIEGSYNPKTGECDKDWGL